MIEESVYRLLTALRWCEERLRYRLFVRQIADIILYEERRRMCNVNVINGARLDDYLK